MFYLIGLIYFLITGYSLLRLLGIELKNIFYAIPLSVLSSIFAYSFGGFLYFLLFHMDIFWIYTLIYLIFTIGITVWKFGIYHEQQYFISLYKNTDILSYFSFNKEKWVYIASGVMMILISLFVILHSKNTSTNTDDATRLRAYTPFIAYDTNVIISDKRKEAINTILGNSAVLTFAPQLFWSVSGYPDHFYINYIISTLFICFVLILFFYPYTNNETRFIITFLVCSIPLFIYHSTTTYADVVYIVPYALGLFFMMLGILSDDKKLLILSCVGFVFTALSKNEGQYMMINGFIVIILYLIFDFKKKKQMFVLSHYMPYILVLISVILFLATKSFYDGTIKHIFDYIVYIFTNHSGTATTTATQVVSKKQLWDIIMYSMFSSHNFGLIFWVAIAGFVLLFRQIFSFRYIWGFILILITVFEIIYTYLYTEVYKFVLDQTTLHRGIIVLAVIVAVYVGIVFSDRYILNEKKI